MSSDNARKRRAEVPSPAPQVGMQLHTADGIRKYLTAGATLNSIRMYRPSYTEITRRPYR